MKNKVYLIIKIVIAVLFAVLSGYLFYIVNKLDILPDKYMIPFIVGIVLLNIFGGICLYIKKFWSKILSIILYLLILLISVIGIRFGSDTLDFLDSAFSNREAEVTTYNLIVLNTSELTLDKIKEVGYFNLDENNEEVLEIVSGKISVEFKEYEDLFTMYDEFDKGEVESLVIDQAYLDILGESYVDIDNKIYIVDSFDIEKKVEIDYEENVELKPLNIYLSGSDSRSNKISNKSRSDVNMIVTINPNTHEILLTSIPRDYYVQVHGKSGLKDKLTHAGIYGLDTSRKTLEDLFDIKIDYSVKIGFNAVVELVDLVGGVTINSDKAFDSYHMPGWRVKKGDNFMDGAKALAYSRERYAYRSGDRHRIKNQQQVLAAVIDKLSSSTTLLTDYDKVLKSLNNFYVTDIPKGLITQAVKTQLDDMSEWKIESQCVSGSDASKPTRTAPNSKRYVMIPYEKDVNNASAKIKSLINKK